MIDAEGFRQGVAIILINDKKHVFWARRIRTRNAWQFPQGGVNEGETAEEAMHRELYEEIGLSPEDIEVVAESQLPLCYRLPERLIRRHAKPLCIGQKQKWFLLRLKSAEDRICLYCSDRPEFDRYQWVHYWYPLRKVIGFKRQVYRQALQEFAPILFPERQRKDRP